jgi:hypothetical protein
MLLTPMIGQSAWLMGKENLIDKKIMIEPVLQKTFGFKSKNSKLFVTLKT